MKPLLSICLLVGLLAGCSSPQVTTDFAEGTDFTAFRTFQYRDSADTLAVTLTVSPRTADHLLDTSVDLCDREVVWNALAEGQIDRSKAVRILRELAGVPDPRREYLELLAIDYAQAHTGHQLHKRLLQMTCDHDPDEALR